MTPEHPITPPPELVREWHYEHGAIVDGSMYVDEYIATQASRFRRIADDELEACCEWLRSKGFLEPAIEDLRAVRRPKPPSLAEQALTALDQADEGLSESEWQQRSDTIRRALERLQELESNG